MPGLNNPSRANSFEPVGPALCFHCEKPFRDHTWRGECIGSLWPYGSALEPRGTHWKSASPITRERALLQRIDEEGRAVPFFTPSLSELIGDPEYDFLAERAPDDQDRPMSRVERRAKDPAISTPASRRRRSILRFLGLAAATIVVLVALTVVRG